MEKRNYSPAAAAKKAGVSRSLISRALSDGELLGQKKNNGHWIISSDALEAWMQTKTVRTKSEKPEKAAAPKADEAAMVAMLKAEIESLKLAIQTTDKEKADAMETREKLIEAQATIKVLEARVAHFELPWIKRIFGIG